MAKPWQIFEKQLIDANSYYRRKGYGCIDKVPNDMKTIRVGGQMISVPSGKTGCDFLGVYRGHAVAIEAKSTDNKASFPFESHNKPRIAPHQIEFLKDFEKSGGKSFICVKFSKVNKCYLLPIDKYSQIEQDALKAKRKSIPIASFSGHLVNERGYILDYLQEVE